MYQRMPALIGRIVSAMLCVPVWGLMVRKLAALAVAGWLVSPVARFDTTAKKRFVEGWNLKARDSSRRLRVGAQHELRRKYDRLAIGKRNHRLGS